MKRNEIINRALAVGKLASQAEIGAKLVNAKTGQEIDVDGELMGATVIATMGYVVGMLENDEDVESLSAPEVLTQIAQRAVKIAYFGIETA